MVKAPPANLLLTLEAVVRLGSFKRAADELLISPSAVSHRVRQLEDLLGRSLFERVGQGVQPTSQALRLADVVGRAQREMAGAWQEVHAEAQSGIVRVSCMAAFAGTFILPVIDRFKRRFPQFKLDLTSSLYSGSPQELRYDILISSGARPGADWWSEEIMPLHVHAIVAPDAKAALVRDGQLHGPLLAFTTDAMTWSDVAAGIGLGYQAGATIITVDSIEAACAAAERGVGVALAPISTARQLIQAGKVVAIGPPVATGMSYWLSTKREDKDSPAFAAFRRWIQRAVTDPGGA